MKKVVQNIKKLREKSQPISDVKEIQDLVVEIKRTLATMPHGIGLGAIQIGIPKQVAVIKDKGFYLELINPEIVSCDDEFCFINEGCLSLPQQRGNTKRYRQIQIKNDYIEDNELKTGNISLYYGDKDDINSDGLAAIAVQHEIDHMNGILIFDHDTSNLKALEVHQPVVASVKVGRNGPCPCGSGKKFKKCCL